MELKVYINGLPFIVSLVLAGIYKLIYPHLPIFTLKIDIASLTIIIGAIISALLFLFYFNQQRIHQKHVDEINLLLDENKQFMQRLDHELKNPLLAIQTSVAYTSQLLADEGITNQKDVLEGIDHIQNQSKRIARLISDLRKIAELETCQIEKTDVDLNLLLTQLVSDAGNISAQGKRNIQLSMPIAPWQLPNIQTDEDLLYISLSNLLNNAMKYSGQDEIIEVRAYENRHSIIIEVADRGIGIPADEIASIWKKLYRARNAKKTDGNGLGLSMVQTIILRLDGEIDLRSTEGVGTVVSIQLPK